MSLEKVTGASVYYLEGAEVHGDIASPVRGDLAIYTYAPTGGFIGQEYSYSGSAWFERTQLKKSADDNVAVQSVMTESSLTEGTLAEMVTSAATLSPKNKGKRWQATDDSDRVYVYTLAGTTWGYYLEPAVDAAGNRIVALGGETAFDSSNVGGVIVKPEALIPHNRNIEAAAAVYLASTNSATWVAGDNIRSLSIHCLTATGAAFQDDDAVLVIINAPDDATAAAWLADVGSSSADVNYNVCRLHEVKELAYSSAITRIDLKPLQSTPLRIIIEASEGE